MKMRLLIIAAGLLLTTNLQAVSYRTNWARYIFADISLGASIEYYEKFADEGDLNSSRAVRWYRQGVRMTNTELFARVESEKNVVRIVKKGSRQVIRGSEVELSTDGLYDEHHVRVVLANLALGAGLARYQSDSTNPDIAEALERLSDSVTVTNLYQMERIRIHGHLQLVKKGTLIPMAGQCIKLDIDEDFYQAEARYMFADICLGGPLAFYRESLRLSRDPNIAAAIRMLEDSVKILNIWQFERKTYAGNQCNIVFKGSETRIDGSYVQLSTDLIGDAEVRYKMVDIGLGAPIGFYRADAGNATNKIMFKLIDDGVRVINLFDFERIRFTDLGMLDVFKGTRKQITGEEVILSSDWFFDEAPVRRIMAEMVMGENSLSRVDYPVRLWASIARNRISEGVTVVNLSQFKIKEVQGKSSVLVYPGTDKPVNGADIILSTDRSLNPENIRLSADRVDDAFRVNARDITHSSDHEWSEGQVRYIMADMALGGPVGFYEECTRKGDPIAVEPYNRWMNGVRVTNADLFERKFVPRIGWKIVYKGTYSIIDPMKVKLTTDR